MDNITLIPDGTGKHQYNVGVEEVRKTLNSLEQHAEGEPNAAPSQGLRRTLHEIHKEGILLMHPERNPLEASK